MKFCNYCSEIREESHPCNSELVDNILLDIVGGEKGLVKKIMSYKLDLEKEEIIINFDRFCWLNIYTKIKQLKIVNDFSNTIKFYFTPNVKYSKTYHCDIKLKNPIILKKNKIIMEDYFTTFDIPLATFYTKRKTNLSMEIQLKNHINKLNELHDNQLIIDYDF